jgi:hypothetical protein
LNRQRAPNVFIAGRFPHERKRFDRPFARPQRPRAPRKRPRQPGIGGTDSDGDNDGGARVHRAGRSQFASGTLQALGQAGVSLANPAGTGGGIGGTDKDGDNDGSANRGPSGNSAVSQAFHAFMPSLFQALNRSGAQTSPGPSDNDSTGAAAAVGASHRLAQYESNAQQLLQSLSSGNAAGNASLTALKSNLQTPLQVTGASSAASGSQPTLQSFLQSRVQGLGGNTVQAAESIVQAQA